MNVGTSPQRIFGGPWLLQNLGPDECYVGEEGVTTSDGVRLSVNECLSAGFSNAELYVVSAGTSDVRLVTGGTGLFTSTPPA